MRSNIDTDIVIRTQPPDAVLDVIEPYVGSTSRESNTFEAGYVQAAKQAYPA